jgi:hypothetical protein
MVLAKSLNWTKKVVAKEASALAISVTMATLSQALEP